MRCKPVADQKDSYAVIKLGRTSSCLILIILLFDILFVGSVISVLAAVKRLHVVSYRV